MTLKYFKYSFQKKILRLDCQGGCYLGENCKLCLDCHCVQNLFGERPSFGKMLRNGIFAVHAVTRCPEKH